MKSLLLLSIIGLVLFACATSSKFDNQIHDKFLIHTHYKIIEDGYFKFLQLNNSIPVKEIIFHYRIGSCSKWHLLVFSHFN